MKTSSVILILSGLILAACQSVTPDPTIIQAAREQTQAAIPTLTRAVTGTFTPQPMPTLTATATSTLAPTTTITPTIISTSLASLPAVKVADLCAKDRFGCAKFLPGQSIKIGMAGPMTGDNAVFGIDVYQGGEIAVADAGDLQGWQFELLSKDDKGSATIAVDVAKEFAADPTVVAIAGHVFSGPSAAAMDIYGKAGLPMLSPSSLEPSLTQRGSKVFNRLIYTDAMQGKFAGNYLAQKLNVKKLAILYDGSTYGKRLAEAVQTSFAPQGSVVSFDVIISGKSDYSDVLIKVAAKKPDALYFGGYIADAIVLVNQMKGAGLDAIFFGCDGTFGNEFISQAGKNAEGAYAVSLAPPDSPEKARFASEYKSAFGMAPDELTPFTWYGYDSVAALIGVIKNVALKSDDGNLYVPRSALVAAVRGLKNYVGLTGTFTCSAVGECNASGPFFYVVKGGEWVPVDNQ